MTRLTFKAWGCIALLGLFLPVFGCSSDGDKGGAATGGSSSGNSDGSNKMLSCATSHCKNDIASSVFESESDCDHIWNGPCPTEYKAYQKCLLDSEACDADGQPTLDSIKGCSAQADALGKCTTDHS